MCDEIFERNQEILLILLHKYSIDKSIRDLLNYESVFVSVEYEKQDQFNNTLKRAILYGNLKYMRVDGEIVKTNKKEILYNFGKKAMKSLSESDIDKTVTDLHLFSSCVKQLKLIGKVELEEGDIVDMLQDFDPGSMHT
jgi:hypothetical protein